MNVVYAILGMQAFVIGTVAIGSFGVALILQRGILELFLSAVHEGTPVSGRDQARQQAGTSPQPC